MRHLAARCAALRFAASRSRAATSAASSSSTTRCFSWIFWICVNVNIDVKNQQMYHEWLQAPMDSTVMGITAASARRSCSRSTSRSAARTCLKVFDLTQCIYHMVLESQLPNKTVNLLFTTTD